MNDALAKQLVRQLKILNFWITSLGLLLLAGMIIMGVLLFQLIGFIKDTSQNINNFTQSTQQNLDLKQSACSGTGDFSDFIRKQTQVCNEN